MLSEDLNVVALCITEDYYSYRGTFKLCCGEKAVDVDLSELSEKKLSQIKEVFGLDESIDVLKAEIMAKVHQAAAIESRIVEGSIK